MRDFIIQVEDYNCNKLMSFRIRSVGEFTKLRDLHNCNLAYEYNNEDDTTVYVFILQTPDVNITKT
jgi:hypothetical protein